MAPSGPYNSDGDLVTVGFDVGRVAIGQGGAEGQKLATPMQMAEVAATVANGGELMRPTFVQRVTDPDGRVTDELDPKVDSTAISPETAAQLTEMMTNVTEEGTAAGLTVDGVTLRGQDRDGGDRRPGGRHQPAVVHRLRSGRRSPGRGGGDDRALRGLLRRGGGGAGRDPGDGEPAER